MKLTITTEVDIDKFLLENKYDESQRDDTIEYFKRVLKGLILLAHSKKLDDQKWWIDNERERYNKFKHNFETEIDIIEQMFKNTIVE